ncbi:MAG: phosphoribosylaminoimidazolesuccinocarboxamide synthase [Candidatus Brocadiia bacterium]
MPQPVMETDLEGLDLFNRGKVRDIYEVDDNLLIVASDRISAYDSVLASGIPFKGKVLTQLTLFWVDYLSDITPTHLITADIAVMDESVQQHADILEGRSMLVKKADVVPIECVVRGYLAGSAWRSYKKTGKICGIELPEGMRQAEQLPEPIFTPATKAESGHDENIPMERAREIAGTEIADQLQERSLGIYKKASEYAAKQGIIISDTKFEWGLCDGELTLIDEVLTPDSSRFWPADTYEPGKSQYSYDKQYVRDWLDESGWDHSPPGPSLPMEVVGKTAERYLQACEELAGKRPE